MVKITVYWENEDPEDYTFEDEDAARMFCADALSKCGSVKYSWKEVTENHD